MKLTGLSSSLGCWLDGTGLAFDVVLSTRVRLARNLFGVPFTHVKFPNEQSFDLEGLRGRVASSSYTPGPDERGYTELFAAMDELFARFSKNGRVTFEYDTEVFYARL